jgi:hypothetical protein
LVNQEVEENIADFTGDYSAKQKMVISVVDSFLQRFLNNASFGQYLAYGRSAETDNPKCQFKTAVILLKACFIRRVSQGSRK